MFIARLEGRVERTVPMILEWLLGSSRPEHVYPWNAVIAERHEEATARMLLGACGPARTVGNRRDEAIVAERERRARQMSERARQLRLAHASQESPRSAA